MLKEKPKASKPMKLQVNTAGAWKDVITAVDPQIGTLAHWTRANGWKEKRHAAA